MKRNIVWTLFFVAILSLSLAAVAKDKGNEDNDGYTCSPAKVAGTWGYSETGSIYVPGPVAAYLSIPEGINAYASVGSYSLDRYGKLSGHRFASLGGATLEAYITGTAMVDPNCTGTVALNFYWDKDLTIPAGTAVKFIVYVDNAKEARMIVTASGYPSVLVTEAKKLSPGHGNEQREDE